MPATMQNRPAGTVSPLRTVPCGPRFARVRAWIDGHLLDDASAPAVGVADHGLTTGDGAFEAVKVVDGRPFALTRHLQRLVRSTRGLGLPDPDLGKVREGVCAVLAGPAWPLAKLRITVTAGPGPLGSGRGDGAATVVVAVEPLPRPAPSVAVVTVPWPRNERGALAGLKTTSYAENVVALAHARERGADEAVFANLAGNLCEGTGSNVCYVVDGQVRTPTLAAGCLAGITRALVLEWYDGVIEIDEPIAMLDRADEVFLTSTTRDVQPVSRWNDRELAAPGPVTAAVQEAWRRGEAAGLDP
jgi:branched-chain amino acid aminotransferase